MVKLMFTSDVILPDTVPPAELRPDKGGLRIGDQSGSFLSPIALVLLRSPIAASTWTSGPRSVHRSC